MGVHQLEVLPKDKAVLVHHALQHKDHKERHQQAGAGVAQGAVPHKEDNNPAGSQQQRAFAAELPPVHHHILPQQAQRKHKPQVRHRAGQRGAHGQCRHRQTRRQESQHQLGQRGAHGNHRSADHPQGQPAQRAAPGGAARSQPAADPRQHQARSI